MSVFKVDKNFKVLLNPDAYRLVPELKGLSQEDILYIILVVDYVDGPFRKLPIEERKLMARKKIYDNTDKDPEKAKGFLEAMDGYKSLVFDIRLETIDVYKSKIRLLLKETMDMQLSVSRMKEIDSSVTFYQDRIDKMEKSFSAEEELEVNLKGQKKLSFLEKWQQRQREYQLYKDGV